MDSERKKKVSLNIEQNTNKYTLFTLYLKGRLAIK